MIKHKAFQIPLENGQKIVFIPSLQKLFLVPVNVDIPEYIDSDEEAVVYYKRPPDYKFRAAHLIINNLCNLECIYCYANAGERIRQAMPLEIAKAAVEKVAKDTQEMNCNYFEVGLIGGEPTMDMPLVKNIVRQTRKIAKKYGLSVRIGIVSNGIFNKNTRQHIIDNLDYITISLDGSEEIQNLHRPFINGKGSFEKVFNNIKTIYDSGLTTGIRCTVSSMSMSKLPEIIEFLNKNFPKVVIGVEPLQECGRCLTTNTYAPDPYEYAKYFIKAMRIANQKEIRIKTSVLRFKCQPNEISFCGVNGQNFAINPEGYVTGCTRVTSKEDPMSKEFYYGKYDYKKKEFIFNPERYEWLKSLTVDNIPGCNDCFARYNCKGDCPIVKSDYGNDFPTAKSPKCEAIQMITKELFKMQLNIN